MAYTPETRMTFLRLSSLKKLKRGAGCEDRQTLAHQETGGDRGRWNGKLNVTAIDLQLWKS